MSRRVSIILFVLYAVIGCLTFGHLMAFSVSKTLPDTALAADLQVDFYASMFWPVFWVVRVGSLL